MSNGRDDQRTSNLEALDEHQASRLVSCHSIGVTIIALENEGSQRS